METQNAAAQEPVVAAGSPPEGKYPPSVIAALDQRIAALETAALRKVEGEVSELQKLENKVKLALAHIGVDVKLFFKKVI